MSSFAEGKLEKKMPPEFFHLFEWEKERFQRFNPEFPEMFQRANSKFEYFHSIVLKLYNTDETTNFDTMPHGKEWRMFVTTPLRNHLVDRL